MWVHVNSINTFTFYLGTKFNILLRDSLLPFLSTVITVFMIQLHLSWPISNLETQSPVISGNVPSLSNPYRIFLWNDRFPDPPT